MGGVGVGWLAQATPTLRPLSTNSGFHARVVQVLRATALIVDQFDTELGAPLQTTTKDGVWCLERAPGHQPTQRAQRERVWYRRPGGD